MGFLSPGWHFLDLQCPHFAGLECIVIPLASTRWTYGDLARQSIYLARYLIDCGVQPGDRVGILAGNRAEYAAAFFACMRVDAILVILNNHPGRREQITHSKYKSD